MIPLHTGLKLEHTYDVVEVDFVTTELFDWLNKSFGPPGERWFFANNKIYFSQEKDYMWFELSW